MNSIETKLHMEIEAVLDKLDAIKDKDSDEYRKLTEYLTQLMNSAIEMEKLGNDIEKHQIQVRESQKERLYKYGSEVGKVLIYALLATWGTCKAIEFEKTGTITTIIGRLWFNKLTPKS